MANGVDHISRTQARGPDDRAAGDSGTGEHPLAIDLSESAPPPEVLEQMARADTINNQLRPSGRQLSFALSSDGCSLQIELLDLDGNLLRVLSAAEAIQIAAGEELD